MTKHAVTVQTIAFGLFLSACASVPYAATSTNTAARSPTTPAAAATTDTVLSERKLGYAGFFVTVRAMASNDGTTSYGHPTITTVVAGSPADSAGLKVGDVILEANGKDSKILGALFPELGVRMVIRVRRGTEEIETSLIPIAPPPRAR